MSDLPPRRLPADGLPSGVLRARVALVLAVTVTLVGAWLATRPVVSDAWFAYAPLSDTVFRPSRPWWSVLGRAMTVVGLLGTGLAAGYLWGRRHRPAS